MTLVLADDKIQKRYEAPYIKAVKEFSGLRSETAAKDAYALAQEIHLQTHGKIQTCMEIMKKLKYSPNVTRTKRATELLARPGRRQA